MKRFDTINVIPLIDVMLVLLAVVLTTASFIVHDSIELDLPDTQTTERYSPSPEETLNLSLDANGHLYANNQPMTFNRLPAILDPLSTSTAIVIKIDERARFGEFVRLVEALKARHFHQLTFLTDKAMPTSDHATPP